MKKLAILSLALAALLLSGCGEKKEQKGEQAVAAPKQEVPAAAQESKKEEAPAATKEAPQETKQESGDQAPAQAGEAAKEAGQDVAKEARKKVEEGVEKVKEAAPAATGAKAAAEQKSETAAAVDGAKLFSKCASCHGPKGERKALGKSGIIAGMAKDEVLKKLKGYQAGTLNQYGMGPLMKGQVAGLSEAELEALADYISKLK